MLYGHLEQTRVLVTAWTGFAFGVGGGKVVEVHVREMGIRYKYMVDWGWLNGALNQVVYGWLACFFLGLYLDILAVGCDKKAPRGGGGQGKENQTGAIASGLLII